MDFYVASGDANGGRYHLEVDGADVTGPVTVNTGSYTSWVAQRVSGVSLTQGIHILRLVVEEQYFDFDAIDIRTGGVAFCGDLTCNGTEDCTSCPGDCGACGPVCGDLICNGTEDCTSCPGDCGTCGSCGDATCDPIIGEGACNCAADCTGSCTQVSSGQNLISAINNANSGDHLQVAPGTYGGGTITQPGVYVENNGAGVVKISGGSTISTNDIVLDGLTWEDQNGQLIQIKGKRNIIRNCEFRRFGKTGASKAIWIREDGDYSDNIIEDNLFEDWANSSTHSSSVKISDNDPPNAQFTGTIVRRNIIRNYASGGNNPGIQPFTSALIEDNVLHDGEDGIEVKGSNVIVRYNLVYNMDGGEAMSNRAGSNNLFEGNTLYNISNGGGLYAWQIWSGSNNVFRNNEVYNSDAIANIKGGTNAGAAPASDVLIINNTFYNNNRGIRWDRKDIPPSNIRFRNNVFYGDGTSAIETTGNGSYTEDYNIFYQFSTPASPGDNSIFGMDPQFVAAASFDFHLSSGSPAIDAGTPTEAPSVDKDGVSRPQGSGVDMGCYELP